MVEWFKHDFKARTHPRLQRIQMRWGMEGIGLYWSVIEMLYEQNGVLMLSECDAYAFALRTDSERLATFMRESGAFIIDGDVVISDTVNERIKERGDKSEKASISAKKRWNDANAMRTHSESTAPVMQRREEKSREDREDRKKEGTHLTVVMPWDTNSFSEIWGIWCKFRTTELRKPKYKEMGEQAALKKLSELAGGDEATAHKIIEQSIANGWQGLFQLRNDKPQHNGARQPLDNLNMEDLAQWINQD